MSQDQDNQNETKEGLTKEEVVLERIAFRGWKDNTKSLEKKTKKKDGKLILDRFESSPKDASQDTIFMAEGQQISFSPQVDLKSNGYTLDGRIQNMVDNSLSKVEVKTTKKVYATCAIDGIDDVDDENITTRAIRACLAAEGVIAALREECNLLPARTTEGKTKSGHARRDCNCPGKGATCNAAISLQLQLAACENLSFAAIAAFRELVATRLGVTILAPSPSISPKKYRKKAKKPKKSSSNETVKGELSKSPSNLQLGSSRGSMLSTKRISSSGGGSLAKEQLPLGPFSCLHPMTTCVLQYEGLLRNSSSCTNALIAEVPLSKCYPDSVCERVVISKSKFKILLCDIDGTLLNSKSILTRKTADALRAAMKIGVLIIIATGKTRPAVIAALDPMGLAGNKGVVSESTPGVFIQGLQVFGKKGKIIHNTALDTAIVEETFAFSVEHQAPLVGFCGDRCVTLFRHTLTDELHDVFYEPEAEVLECMDQMKKAKVQKVVFHDDPERVTSFLRPHWSLALQGRANVVQSLPDMLEVLPPGASKGAGVQVLLDHLDVSTDEVMAIGDGENDIEMLTLAGWGVAMGNANSVVKAVAKAVTTSNDEDGVAKAIEEYIL